MPTIYTAIFGPYDTLKEPRVITPGWTYVCFTNQDLKSNVWKIKKRNPPYPNRMAARYVKIQFQHFIEDNKSIWIDASFTINCNLNEWWEKNFKGQITCINHPVRNCVYEEAAACISLKRGIPEKVRDQINSYLGLVPRNNGLIQSGVLMREKTHEVIDLCNAWYFEVSRQSDRDQIAFGKVSIGKPFIHYMNWDYRTAKEFIISPHNQKQ